MLTTGEKSGRHNQRGVLDPASVKKERRPSRLLVDARNSRLPRHIPVLRWLPVAIQAMKPSRRARRIGRERRKG
jgi:hypothetical protein